MPTPAIRITDKPVSTPCEQTHFLVTQPELPEGYTPTGEETEEELAALKVESLREIDVNSLTSFINQKPVEFTQASERENIASGEAPSALFGKIKKWFSDLKNAAFHTVANNYTTTAEGYVLDARLGPAIKTAIDGVAAMNASTTWTPKLYDFDTYKRDLPGYAFWTNLGRIKIAYYFNTSSAPLDLSGISTMMQIRTVPFNDVLGGLIYFSAFDQTGSKQPHVIQQSVHGEIFIRPNVVSSMFSTPSDAGSITVIVFGV